MDPSLIWTGATLENESLPDVDLDASLDISDLSSDVPAVSYEVPIPDVSGVRDVSKEPVTSTVACASTSLSFQGTDQHAMLSPGASSPSRASPTSKSDCSSGADEASVSEQEVQPGELMSSLSSHPKHLSCYHEICSHGCAIAQESSDAMESYKEKLRERDATISLLIKTNTKLSYRLRDTKLLVKLCKKQKEELASAQQFARSIVAQLDAERERVQALTQIISERNTLRAETSTELGDSEIEEKNCNQEQSAADPLDDLCNGEPSRTKFDHLNLEDNDVGLPFPDIPNNFSLEVEMQTGKADAATAKSCTGQRGSSSKALVEDLSPCPSLNTNLSSDEENFSPTVCDELRSPDSDSNIPSRESVEPHCIREQENSELCVNQRKDEISKLVFKFGTKRPANRSREEERISKVQRP